MKLSDYFSDLNYCGTITEYIKVFKNGSVIYHGRIISLLENKEISTLVLINQPKFVTGVGYIAYVK